MRRIGFASTVVVILAACAAPAASPSGSGALPGVVVGNHPSGPAPTVAPAATAAPSPTPSPTPLLIVVTPAPTPTIPAPVVYTCDGDPATTTYRTDERVSIIFNGFVCTLEYDADVEFQVMDVDSDEGLNGWNAEAGYPAWDISGVGDHERAGDFEVIMTRTTTGEELLLSFTVAVKTLSGGDVRITVSDVTIRDVPLEY